MTKCPHTIILVSFLSIFFSGDATAEATIYEKKIEIGTYRYSDPSPVGETGRFYPYFRFDGFTSEKTQDEWTMVVLENDHIKVWVAPEIGGKVWRALEKSTGKDFLYFNDVVKFRAVAMRGPWTSGGIEFNFGSIGHTVNVATPVDYKIRTNEDGSVSCVVGNYDFTAGTRWSVEIRLAPDQAFFTTRSRWFNLSSLPTSYYHWTNAAARASRDLEFIYPGTHYIGHGGEVESWPEQNGKNLALYRQNNFGSYKSYHVLGAHSEFFGGYYHDEDFGFGHWTPFDEKPGKKLWIWGLSREGMIWENLLTDNSGQYIEWQSGKLFNQAASDSSLTPFKHSIFLPGDSDNMSERWFPLVETGSPDFVSGPLVFSMGQMDDGVRITMTALAPISDTLDVFSVGRLVKSVEFDVDTLQKRTLFIRDADMESLRLHLGKAGSIYDGNRNAHRLQRPLMPDPTFDFDSTYGAFMLAKELEAQRQYEEALDAYLAIVHKWPSFTPVLSKLALAHLRRGEPDVALSYAQKALSHDTYDAETNYMYGLIQTELGELDDARSGFGIAAADPRHRVPAHLQLAKLALKKGDAQLALRHADKSINFNGENLTGWQLRALALDDLGRMHDYGLALQQIESLDRTFAFAPFERYLRSPDDQSRRLFLRSITGEFPSQTLLELALFYVEVGQRDTALRALSMSEPHPIVRYWQAYLLSQSGRSDQARKRLEDASKLPSHLVFPFRYETLQALDYAAAELPHWQANYYRALIYKHLGRGDDALDILIAAGEVPDYAPFYLFRIGLVPNSQERDIEIALRLAPDDWRVQYAAARFFAGDRGRRHTDLALELNPKQPELVLAKAQWLFKTGEIDRGFEFLSKQHILPSEGATSGRKLFHQYSIVAALNAFENGNTSSARGYIEQSRLWPENLGAGRPYDPDERIADYMTAYMASVEGEVDRKKTRLQKVVDYDTTSDATIVLQLLAAKQLDNNAAYARLRARAMTEDNEAAKWAIGKADAFDKIDQIDVVELIRQLLSEMGISGIN